MGRGLDSRYALRKICVHVIAQGKRPPGSIIKSGVVILQPLFPLTFQEFIIMSDLKGENSLNKISIRLIKGYHEGSFRKKFLFYLFTISSCGITKLKTFFSNFNFNTLKSEHRSKFLESADIITRYKQKRLTSRFFIVPGSGLPVLIVIPEKGLTVRGCCQEICHGAGEMVMHCFTVSHHRSIGTFHAGAVHTGLFI